MWQKFPDFGKIFIAKLFKECPFLVPHKPPKFNGQSDVEFLTSWGYRVTNSHFEEYVHYQARTSKFAALMATIWITHSRRDEQTPHPFGIAIGWKYLATILNSEPDPLYLHIVDKILEVAGSTLHGQYKTQFVKLMIVMRDHYLPSVERKVDEGMKAAFDRLRDITVAKFFSKKQFSQPRGRLPDKYW